MENIKILRLAFVLAIGFIEICGLEAQTWPPVTIQNNQNFQYSNYQFTPFAVNPALAGSDGLYRFSTVYGDKFMGVGNLPFGQFSLSSEYTILKGFKKGDKIGVGLGADFLAASGSLNGARDIRNFIFNTSYHYSLHDDATSFLSLGLQYRTSTSSSYIQLAHYNTNNQTGDIDVLINQGNRNVQNIYGPLNVNWAAGLLYRSVSGNNVKSFGISTFRLNNLTSKDGNPLDQRGYGFNAHGAYDINLYKNISITPGFFYSNFEFSKLLNINTNVSYWINKEKMTKVYLGLGVTDVKKTIIYAGATFKGINIGLAYDWGTKPTDNNYGVQKGLELCASYTGLAKKP